MTYDGWKQQQLFKIFLPPLGSWSVLLSALIFMVMLSSSPF